MVQGLKMRRMGETICLGQHNCDLGLRIVLFCPIGNAATLPASRRCARMALRDEGRALL